MSTESEKQAPGYVHGFTEKEQNRLYHQARFMEQRVHDRLPFHRSTEMLEIGCGVGAQSEILLRRYPGLRVTGLDASDENLGRAQAHLASLSMADGRYECVKGNALALDFPAGRFDSAFLCWVLEHVPDPARVLSEARRCLRPGSHIAVTEVQNMSFFLNPYSPNTMAYWLAFNDHQLELGGDPFVGAKLGNLLLQVGYRDIRTRVHSVHLDNRSPGERAEFLEFWTDLLLSGAEGLLSAGKTTPDIVDGMREELDQVGHHPDAVFFYSFVQATARVF